MSHPPMAAHRAAWLEIDLDALTHNIDVIRHVVGPAASVAAVVKADGYGHGLDAVAATLERVCDALAVATLDEALALRAHGIDGRVIALYPVPADGLDAAIDAEVELTLMSFADLEDLADTLEHRPLKARVHLAIETGMSRGGLDAASMSVLARALLARPSIEAVGIWTHLARATHATASQQQLARFDAAVSDLVAAGLTRPARHVAASEGIFARTAPAFEMVRPGLAVYGVLDDRDAVSPALRDAAGRLRPAMSLKARAAAFSDVPRGSTVGYAGTWRAERPTRVAILPLGYGDGYVRGTRPGASVILRGRRVPLVGVISMDAIAVDVTDETDVDAADEFVLLGQQGDAEIDASELARWRNTIAWETLSGMAPRLARVYNRSAGAAPKL